MNETGGTPIKPRFKPGAGTLTFLAVTAFFIFLAWPYLGPWGDRPFDRETWLEHAGDMRPKNPRRAMRKDLLENRLRPGMTMKQVWALLGRPDFPTSCKEMSDEEIKTRLDCFSYTFGWSLVDPESLNMVFGTDGRLESVRVVNH